MVVIVMGYGVISNKDEFKKFGLYMLILISLITFLVFYSGEKAAGMVKGLEGVMEENIGPHAQFADLSYKAMEITGIISLACLIIFRKEKRIPVWLGVILLILIIGVNLMMAYTGHLGGKINHFELMNLK
jgi:hypothetical protein